MNSNFTKRWIKIHQNQQKGTIYISLQTIENTTTQKKTTKYADRNSGPGVQQAYRSGDVTPINEIPTLPGESNIEANKIMDNVLLLPNYALTTMGLVVEWLRSLTSNGKPNTTNMVSRVWVPLPILSVKNFWQLSEAKGFINVFVLSSQCSSANK